MSDVSRPDWIVSTARLEAAKLNLPVAVVRSFSADSRRWAAQIRQQLADLGVAVIDAKPPLGHSDIPRLAAIVIAPGALAGPAWQEAAHQDVPIIAADHDHEPPPIAGTSQRARSSSSPTAAAHGSA